MIEGKNGAIELTDADVRRLREKYRLERDKRFRPDGRSQFVKPTGEYARLLEDPFSEPFERAPLFDEVDAVIIGAGYGGLMAGARLREAGVKRIRMIDQAGDVGGTWYWNRYPGARCDVESYIYMPLLEETGFMPTEKYATGGELLEHARRIARQYDLYKDACFQTDVFKTEWDQDASRWLVHTRRGDQMRARFLLCAPGPLRRVHLPDIPGIADFKGHAFLACRWDYDFTKGDEFGGMTGLAGKRVAMLGTGATAIQVVPLLAQDCEHLYVVQRTPSPVGPRPNPPTDPEWAASLAPGWQEERMRSFSAITIGGREDVEDLVQDEFTYHFGNVARTAARLTDPDERRLALELVDFMRDEQMRRYVDSLVADPDVAEQLKHYYRYFCKRPTFSATYYQTFNRSNVTLVNTDGRGLDRITEKSIVCGDAEYEVDCIIIASGYEADIDYHIRSGFEIVGRGGITLAEKWDDGIRAFHSVNVRDFPNLFLVGNPAQGGFYLNFVHKLHEDMKLVKHIVEFMLRNDKETVEPTEEAEEAWVEEILRLAVRDLAFQEACTPGQYNQYGETDAKSPLRNSAYGLGPVEWERLMQEWRNHGDLEGLEFTVGRSIDSHVSQVAF